MRCVHDAALIPDSFHNFFHRQTHRDALGEKQTDELGAAATADLLADYHQLRVNLPRSPRTVQTSMIRDGNAVEIGLTGPFYEVPRRRDRIL